MVVGHVTVVEHYLLIIFTDKTYTVKPVLRGQSREGQKLAA